MVEAANLVGLCGPDVHSEWFASPLPSGKSQWFRSAPFVEVVTGRPVALLERVTYCSCQVQEKSNYKPVKWIRYITKAGQYEYRI